MVPISSETDALIAAQNSKTGHQHCQLFEGDFRQIGFDSKYLQPNSVDLLFTDPLYYEIALHLHKDLSKLAYRVLRPGGSYLIYLVPQNREPMLYNYVLESSNLLFWDRFEIKMRGPFWTNFQTRVIHQTKTLAWFCKGDRPTNPLIENNKNLFDIIESETPDKTLSPYAQSQVEARKMIEALTSVNNLVLDPMLGMGTTGLAAIKLRRRFMGVEIDKATMNLAKANILRNLQ